MCYYKISGQLCTKALGKGTEQDVKPKIVDCSFRSLNVFQMATR
jgi:hypothetical protein